MASYVGLPPQCCAHVVHIVYYACIRVLVVPCSMCCGCWQHGPFYLNEEVSDKLKILDYESTFCEENDIVPFPKTYFAMPSGAYVPVVATAYLHRVHGRSPNRLSLHSGQFDNFMYLAKWLFDQANRSFTTDKFDDPNTTCVSPSNASGMGVALTLSTRLVHDAWCSVNKLMLELKNIGFEMDFPASKLRSANGEATCRVLNFLCDQALIARGFRWQNPVYPEEECVLTGWPTRRACIHPSGGCSQLCRRGRG